MLCSNYCTKVGDIILNSNPIKRFLNLFKKEPVSTPELQELYKIIDDMLESPDRGNKELYNYYCENCDNNHGFHL